MKNIIDITGSQKREKNNDPFRGLPFRDGYVEYPLRDNTAISVGLWVDNINVKPHCHTYYEFVLIKKGVCIYHNEKGTVPLTPGDMFLIMPHNKHSYEVQGKVEIYNCAFIPEGLNEEFNQVLSEFNNSMKHYQACLNNERVKIGQEILHLDPPEMEVLEYHLQEIIREQDENLDSLEHAKSAHLELILIHFKRILLEYEQTINKYTDQRQEMIQNAVKYIDLHLYENINIDELAASSYVCSNYFRTIFKDVIGMRPVEYINRERIIHSLQYLAQERYSIQEISAKVGFSDPNYYSRVFKYIMGLSPREYIKIQKSKLTSAQ